MARLSGVLFVALVFPGLSGVSAAVLQYIVTFVSCTMGSSCPQGNYFSQTFALNGTISPNLTLTVDDQLTFLLATNVTIHPLTICRNSSLPRFCEGTSGSDKLNTPITQAGSNASVTFATAGTYYYGCLYHSGMGATINVIQKSTGRPSTSTRKTTRKTTRRSTSKSTRRSTRARS